MVHKLYSQTSIQHLLLFLLPCIVMIHAALRPESDLTKSCYDFPQRDFGLSNCIKCTYESSPHIVLKAGSNAIDFTLPSENGIDNINLGTLLKDKPVVLLFGHYTCPAYQGYGSFASCSWEAERDFVKKTKKAVTVVHIVSSEPHPVWPYSNYDSGSIVMKPWSTYKQPQTFEERMELSVSRVREYMHPDALLVVDHLDGAGGESNNPVWCSYVHGARAAIVISKDGEVLFTQDWFDGPELTEYILDKAGG